MENLGLFWNVEHAFHFQKLCHYADWAEIQGSEYIAIAKSVREKAKDSLYNTYCQDPFNAANLGQMPMKNFY